MDNSDYYNNGAVNTLPTVTVTTSAAKPADKTNAWLWVIGTMAAAALLSGNSKSNSPKKKSKR